MPTRFLHDCRRTAARNLIRASVPERVAMLLTGHKTRAIFDRYNIINEQELLEAGDQLVAYLAQHAQATPRGGRPYPAGTAVPRTALQTTGTSQPAIVAPAATGLADAANHGHARRDSTTSSCNDRHLQDARTPTCSGVSASAGCSVSTRVVGPLIAPYAQGADWAQAVAHTGSRTGRSAADRDSADCSTTTHGQPEALGRIMGHYGPGVCV